MIRSGSCSRDGAASCTLGGAPPQVHVQQTRGAAGALPACCSLRAPPNHVVPQDCLLILVGSHLGACCVVARGCGCWVHDDELQQQGRFGSASGGRTRRWGMQGTCPGQHWWQLAAAQALPGKSGCTAGAFSKVPPTPSACLAVAPVLEGQPKGWVSHNLQQRVSSRPCGCKGQGFLGSLSAVPQHTQP